MGSRLIPWSLAASAVVAVIVLGSRPGGPGEAGRLLQVSPTARLAAAARHFTLSPVNSSQASPTRADAGARRPNAAPQSSFPLPSAAASGPPADVQPVPDDQPTVDDLAGRETPAT